MRKVQTFLFFAFILSSCNYRIYTNSHYDHKEKGLTSKWRSKNDSCLVFEANEKVPDHTVFINEIKTLSPFFWMTTQPFKDLLINKALDEAKRTGANVIKITEEHVSKFTRYHFVTKMYSLKEPYLTSYIKHIDSLKRLERTFYVIPVESKQIIHNEHLTTPWIDTIIVKNDVKLKPCKFYWGGDMGVGYSILNGNTSKYFQNTFGFRIDFNLGWKRLFMEAGLLASENKNLKEPFSYHNLNYTKDSISGLENLNVNFGYALYKKRKFQFIPYIGIGNWASIIASNSPFDIGFIMDWTFHKSPFYDGRGGWKRNWQSLRLNAGFTPFRNGDSRFNGSIYYVKLLFVFESRFANTL